MTTIRTIINTTKAPAAIGVYSQAVKIGNTLYLSGAIGLDPKTGDLVPGGVEAEARQCFKNIGAILDAAGCTFNNLVKVTVLLADIKDFALLNGVYQENFTKNYPARACFQVAALPKGARVEIETIAVVGDIIDSNPSAE
jgi:2-iminobutanoate/2-iminopropanoate deaminase